MRTPEAGHPAELASDTGARAEYGAGAANPVKSTLSQIRDTAVAVKLGAQLLPAGWRLFKRYPMSSALVVLAVVWTVYSTRSHRTSLTGKSQS
jgi:hypothetical protein